MTISEFIEQFTEIALDYELIGNEYFLVDEKVRKVKDQIKHKVISAGTFLGKDQGDKFVPSLALIEIISKQSDKKIFIDEKAEWLFLCKRDIFLTSITKKNVESGIVLVQNQHDENLGLGNIKKDQVKHILDRGDYLRRER